MTRTEHLLTIIAEECAEVAHRVSKALRFGLAEVQPGQELTNAQRIMAEVNDFIAVYQMLAGPLVSPTTPLFEGDPNEWMARIRGKQAKVEQYLAYSKVCGTLADDPAGGRPIDVVLHCPKCGAQHIDAPEPEKGWDNPPHKSHLCHTCGAVWRPADVPTNGVAAAKTRGERDTV